MILPFLLIISCVHISNAMNEPDAAMKIWSLLKNGKKGNARTARIGELLASGINPNIKHKGTSLLNMAASQNDIHLCKRLLAFGARLETADISTAATYQHTELCCILLEHEANEFEKILKKGTKITNSHIEFTISGIMRQEMLQKLLQYGADPRMQIGKDRNPVLIELVSRFESRKIDPMLSMIICHVANNRKKARVLMCVFNRRKEEAWAKLLYTHAKDLIKKHVLNILYQENTEELRLALSDTKTKVIEDYNDFLGRRKHIRQTAYDIYQLDILNPSDVESTMKKLWKE